jgi:predicted nucleic acid-binding protein
VVDSSVVAKWALPEADSPRAQQLMSDAASTGGRLFILDLALVEVANAVWKRQRQHLITPEEARGACEVLLRTQVEIVPASRLLPAALQIGIRCDRTVYDALFVALSEELQIRAVTADEPLFNVVHDDFPRVLLLRNM